MLSLSRVTDRQRSLRDLHNSFQRVVPAAGLLRKTERTECLGRRQRVLHHYQQNERQKISDLLLGWTIGSSAIPWCIMKQTSDTAKSSWVARSQRRFNTEVESETTATKQRRHAHVRNSLTWHHHRLLHSPLVWLQLVLAGWQFVGLVGRERSDQTENARAPSGAGGPSWSIYIVRTPDRIV